MNLPYLTPSFLEGLTYEKYIRMSERGLALKRKKKTLWGQEHTLCGDIKNRRQRTNKQTWNVWIKGKTTKVGHVQNLKKKAKKKAACDHSFWAIMFSW